MLGLYLSQQSCRWGQARATKAIGAGQLLLQLHQAGVLARQKAVVLGAFSAWKPTPSDRGYSLKTAIAHLRSVTTVPVLTGLPFGHVHPKVCLPVGRRAQLLVDGRNALIGW